VSTLTSLNSLRQFNCAHSIFGCEPISGEYVMEHWTMLDLDETLSFNGKIKVFKDERSHEAMEKFVQLLRDKYPAPKGFHRVWRYGTGVLVTKVPLFACDEIHGDRGNGLTTCRGMAKSGTPVILGIGRSRFGYNFSQHRRVADGDFVVECREEKAEIIVLRYDPVEAKRLASFTPTSPVTDHIHSHGKMRKHEIEWIVDLMRACICQSAGIQGTTCYIKWGYSRAPRREWFINQLLLLKDAVLKLHGHPMWRQGWQKSGSTYLCFMEEALEAYPAMRTNGSPWDRLAIFIKEERDWMKAKEKKMAKKAAKSKKP